MSRARTPPTLDPALLLDSVRAGSSLVFWVRDVEGRYTTVSRGFCELMGVEEEACIGRTASEFMPPEIAAFGEEVYRRIVASGEPSATEETHVIGGLERHFMVHRVPVRDREGKVVGVFGVSTEHTVTVRILRQMEAMNRVLALFSHAVSIESYAEGLVDILVRETGCGAVGVRALEAVLTSDDRPGTQGRDAAPFLAQRGFPAALTEAARDPGFLRPECACAAVVRGDASAVAPAALDGDGCLCVPDVESLTAGMDPATPMAEWVSWGFRTLAILPLYRQDEALGCLVLGDAKPGRLTPDTIAFLHRLLPVVSEAMHRFTVERRLETSRTRLQSVVRALPLPVWVVDARYRVVFRNEAHERHFGPAPEGSACHQVLRGRKDPCPECEFPETLMRLTTRREWQDPRTDRTYDLIAVPYDTVSGERQRLEVFFDITDRVRTEAQLRQTQRLDSLGSLAAGVAHDFNNILAGIIGYSQLGLQRSKPGSDSAQVFEQVAHIAERGAELTRKILAFSRRQPLKVAALDLNALITDLRTMILPLAGDRVEVVLDLAEGLWAVQGDGSQIEQVVLNLCVNAVEAMPAGGRLTVRTRNLDGQALRRALAYAPRGPATLPPGPEPLHGVLIEVSDTGHGMPPDVVSQAIEPFFTTKGRGRGTGLGLSVSYGIVQQHHGNLVIESAVGAGTRVRVFLPAMDVTPSRVSRPACVQPASRTPARFPHGPALVVEDDPPIRGLVATLLAELGIEARTAANGSEAIEALSSDEAGIRLVITDVAMPGMSGLMLARRIREVRPDVSVVFMSGCSDATLEQVGLTDDDVLLRKPFTLEDLLSGIEAAVSRNS